VAVALTLGVQGVHSFPAESRHRVQDDVGRSLVVPVHPNRIVSLAPSVTQMLFALGAGERVVGVTDQCDDPPRAHSLPKVGGMVKPDWESVVRLRPDLIVASTSGNDASLVSQSEELGLPLYFTDARDIKGLLDSLGHLAELVGAAAKGDSLRRSLEGRLRALQERAGSGHRPRVLFLVWIDPPVVPGSGTFLNDALRLAGLDSITADAPAGWPTYDLESILEQRPEWIVTAEANAAAVAALMGRPGWKDLEAVRSARVVTVSGNIERPSPKVVEAMEDLQRKIQERESE
jgi:cobalamin transport system substrate-binding protein